MPYTTLSRSASALGRARAVALAVGLGLSLALAPLAWAEDVPSSAPLVQLPSLAPIVKRVVPAVVNISVLEKPGLGAGAGDQDADNDSDPGTRPGIPPGSPFDQFLRKFFEDQGINPSQPAPRVQRTALGSGFIVDPSGYVVTNNHVVGDAEKVTVILQDNSKHPAKIIGRDPKTDLALIKIDVGHPLPYVSWADSNASQVGDWVIAVGNPFGLGGTVSAGIISARGRDIHSGPYDDFLQIDAPINRGNSGGPTFNLDGQVIGVNTAIYSPNGGSVGIGFAIPSSLAKPLIQQIRETGKVSRGWLGVQIQEVTPEIGKSLGYNGNGALVSDVTKDGPADKAGFKQGDVIQKFNGHELTKLRDLPLLVAETPVGQTAKVQVWRKGSAVALNPKIAEQPENLEVSSNEQAPAVPQRASALGLKLAPLTDNLRRQLHVQKNVKGAVVTAITDDSPLTEVDLRPGDVIVAINQQPVTSPTEAVAKLREAESGQDKRLLLLVNRHGINEYIAWSGQSDNG